MEYAIVPKVVLCFSPLREEQSGRYWKTAIAPMTGCVGGGNHSGLMNLDFVSGS
jgi:hypothetical protein